MSKTLTNEEIDAEIVALLREGAEADIWYDADIFSDDEDESDTPLVTVIERTQHAMRAAADRIEGLSTPATPPVPTPIEWELETCLFGMRPDDEGFTLADDPADVTHYDVALHLRFPQTGQIEVLIEREDMDEADAHEAYAALRSLFPDANENIWPE